MNKARIKELNKKIDKFIGIRKIPIFPILGGAAMGAQTRIVTQEEGQILKNKGIPVPMYVALNRETEFLGFVKNEM